MRAFPDLGLRDLRTAPLLAPFLVRSSSLSIFV